MENHLSLGGGNEERKQENSHLSNEPAATPKHSTRWDTSRPTIAPNFLLSRAHGPIYMQGIEEQLFDPWLAAKGLHSDIHKMVVGILPFDLGKLATLTTPQEVIRFSQPLEPPAYYRWNAPELHADVVACDPPLDEHIERIATAIRTIEYSALEKVVLMCIVELEIDPPIDPLLLASRLIDGPPNRGGFVVGLSPAGSDYEDRLLIGSSLETLVRRMGDIAEAFPLAEPLSRSRNEKVGRVTTRRLAGSRKNLDEHAFVVDGIVDNLAPLCSSLDVPDSPKLTSIVGTWYLAAHIRSRLRDPPLSVLDLALVVHPMPVTCGTPTESTFGVIQTTETDRGFYSGAVGWCDENDDGEFMVSIRCAEIGTERSMVRLWAGGSVMSHFGPEEGVTEINVEMDTVPRVFGVKGA